MDIANAQDRPAAPEKIDWWLWKFCFSRMAVGLVFMSYAAAVPLLMSQWSMSAAQAGSIATGFHLGYAVSLVIFSALADRIGAKPIYLISITLGAITSAVFALFARDFLSGLILYTLVGLSFGGTYPPGMMLLAERYPVRQRGRAIGAYIASTSLGYALCLGISGPLLALGGYRLSFLVTGLIPLIGTIVAWYVLAEVKTIVPQRDKKKGFAGEVLRNKPAVILIAGYTFHSYECLGMWAWAPAFLAVCLAGVGGDATANASLGSSLSSFFHLTGIAASFSMGLLSDRIGRVKVLVGMAGLSAICSFIFGWTMSWPMWLILILGGIYAFACLGDSPVISAAMTESIDPAYIGSAFGLRSLIGFGVGAAAPSLFGLIMDAVDPSGSGAPLAWGLAFTSLGLTGLGATICAAMFGRLRSSR